MTFIDDLADRLGVSKWVIWAGIIGIAIALYIVIRRAQSNVNAASTTNTSGDVLNGPFGSGIDGTSANPNPPSPNGGADTGTTPAPVVTPPAPGAPVATHPNAFYVHPTPWPTQGSTISGLAKKYGTSVATIESFPENQYIRARSSRGWNLIYTSDTIRIR